MAFSAIEGLEHIDKVIETLEEYITNLTHFRDMMKQDDFDAIFNEMKNTNYIKDILNGIA